MTSSRFHASTGIHDLDRVLCGLAAGDNVVWQVETMADYATFVRPFAEAAVRQGAPLTYFRFARHEALLEERPGVSVLALNTHLGFETFFDAIHQRIETQGRGACYVFDCMSLSDCSSDRISRNLLRRSQLGRSEKPGRLTVLLAAQTTQLVANVDVSSKFAGPL